MRWIAIAGVLAVAALAAGCGGGSGDESATQTDGAAAAETAGADETAGGEAAAGSGGEGEEKAEEGGFGYDGKGGEGGSGTSGGGSGATIKVVESQFGEVIADGSGEALYLFDKEGGPTSECYGECAEAWPPMLTSGKPKAGSGADAALLGTTEREDGELQVTYDGHPLYYYVDDSPGTILCHNVPEFGGLWLVVQPNGEAVA